MRERLRATFEEVAEAYDRARPTYPPELFDDLADLTGLRAGSRVLEIGCGTGQAIHRRIDGTVRKTYLATLNVARPRR